MDRTAAVARMKQGLGFRKNLDDVCVAALQEAQREFELGGSLPWFLVEEDATITTEQDSSSIELPDGWLRIYEDEGPYYLDPDGGLSYIQFRPYDELKKFYNSTDAGAPAGLAIRNGTFAVFPVPDAAYTITLSYYKAADVLTSDVENAWLANVPDLLINRAGMLVAADIEHSTALKKFSDKYDMWRVRYLSEIAARADQNSPRQMGVNQ